MYYSDYNNPYKNDRLNYYLKKNLPMEEFATGNFSQVDKIMDVYKEYLKTCFDEAKKRYIGENPDIKTHIGKDLEKLKQQYQEQTEIKWQSIKKMEDIKKEIQKEQEALEAEKKWDKSQDVFIKFMKKANWNFTNFINARDRLEIDNPKKHKEMQNTYHNFLNSLHTKKIQELQLEFSRTKSDRNKAKRKLSHKSNSTNIEKEIKEIEIGTKWEQITRDIKKEVEKILRKRSSVGNDILDSSDMKDFFTRIVCTQLITNANIQPRLKKELIKNHTDKLWLFDHIRNLHTEHRYDIHKLINDPEGKEKDIRNQMIESLVQNAKGTLKRIPSISWYFRLGNASSEKEFEERNKMWATERKKKW